jgi:uncharacterized membrane protein YedE/YeeE
VLLKLSGILLGVSCLASLYMVFLALRAGDVNGSLLFFGFAMLLGFTAAAIFRRWNQECSVRTEYDRGRPPAPVRFVPHWFLMAALILTALAVLAAGVVPLVLR